MKWGDPACLRASPPETVTEGLLGGCRPSRAWLLDLRDPQEPGESGPRPLSRELDVSCRLLVSEARREWFGRLSGGWGEGLLEFLVPPPGGEAGFLPSWLPLAANTRTEGPGGTHPAGLNIFSQLYYYFLAAVCLCTLLCHQGYSRRHGSKCFSDVLYLTPFFSPEPCRHPAGAAGPLGRL